MTVNDTHAAATDNNNNIKSSIAAKTKYPLKRAHRISATTFVVIDERLVRQLGIDENNTWFEQEQTENGIILRIRRHSCEVR
jgi:hypothetical protein